MFNKRRLLSLVCVLLTTGAVLAQEIPDEYNGVEYRGSFDYVARGVMDGNLIETNFRNHGELARWGDLPWGVWPRGIGGRHIDGIGVVVAGRVPGFNNTRFSSAQDYVDFVNTVAPGQYDVKLNPVSINYRDAGARQSPYTGNLWGWLPLPGFNNPFRRNAVGGAESTPAISTDPTSWPEFWPDRLNDVDDPGWGNTPVWNGRDGKRANADKESYYVMDDFSDHEYSYGLETGGAHSQFGTYYPNPSDTLMGGLGLQNRIRIFQWANILAEDTMFLIYEVTNKGEADHDSLFFVQIVDYGLGQDENDDNGFYDPILDVVYGWDSNGVGTATSGGQYTLGYTGFAFLESPGNIADNLDNDQDGITDEIREDELTAASLICSEPYLGAQTIINAANSGGVAADGYVHTPYDLDAFQEYYGEPIQDRPAVRAGVWFPCDENMDWVGFEDVNGNGMHDPDENLNDDIGADGLGVFDFGYPGPDTGEGDGIPTPGEPNYGKLDVDESDQIGLTGFDLNSRSYYENSNTLPIDNWMWDHIEMAQFESIGEELTQSLSNDEPFFLFSSGPTILDNPGTNKPANELKITDRFSTAWIFGNDEDDFLKNRRTVQNIYDADYNFAQPPIPPTLTAVPGDGRVVLSWDAVSVNSYDRFLQDFDFEGYRLYRGTNNLFTDARTITDVNGTPTFYEPIAQWDLAVNRDGTDNEIMGPKTVLEGTSVFDMGSNTGLAFHYVDTDVTNGKGYYYALTAYDRGVDTEPGSSAPGIDPQENTFRVAVNINGVVTNTSSNTAFVVPRPAPAGYTEGGATVDISNVTGGTGSGSAAVNVVTETDLIDNYEYRVNFFSEFDSAAGYRVTTDFEVLELTQPETIISRRAYESSTNVINGFTMDFENADQPGEIIESRTGYLSNPGTENEIYDTNPANLDGVESNWEMEISLLPEGTTITFSPTDDDYELTFLDPNAPEDELTRTERYLGPDGFSREYIALAVENVTSNIPVSFLIQDNDDSESLTPGDLLVLTEIIDRGFNHRFIILVDEIFGSDGSAPAPGTKFYIRTTRQFGSDDYFQFGVQKGSIDDSLATSQLDNIYVVPNPYVGYAEWERRASPDSQGRGERKINFMNIPRICTIRIFNIRGELLKRIDHVGSYNDGSVSWDLKTENNEDIAYGVYFYHVSAYNNNGDPIGEYVDKFAVIK